jgi:hypothetical protein
MYGQIHKTYVLPLPKENYILDFCIEENFAYFIAQNTTDLLKSNLEFKNFEKSEIVVNGQTIDFMESILCNKNKLLIKGNELINGGLYAGGSEETIIFESSDGGMTWEKRLPEGTLSLFAEKILYNNQEYFALLSPGNGTNKILYSTNEGESWTNLYTSDHHKMSIAKSKFHKLIFTDGIHKSWKIGYFDEQFKKVEFQLDGYNSIKFVREDDFGNFEFILNDSKYYRLDKDFTTLEFLYETSYKNFYIDAQERYWHVDQKYNGDRFISTLFFSNDFGKKWNKFDAWLDSLSGQGFMVRENSIYTAYKNELHVFSDISLLDEEKLFDIKVYPNPFENEILVEEFTNIINAKLIELSTGRVIINQENVRKIIETKSVNKGFYLLKLLNDRGQMLIRKMVKTQ